MPDWLREILDWIAGHMEAAALIGGALVVAMGYVTGFFKWLGGFFEKTPPENPALSQKTGDGGVNVGGDVQGDVRVGDRRDDAG